MNSNYENYRASEIAALASGIEGIELKDSFKVLKDQIEARKTEIETKRATIKELADHIRHMERFKLDYCMDGDEQRLNAVILNGEKTQQKLITELTKLEAEYTVELNKFRDLYNSHGNDLQDLKLKK